jgi:hypothetical protein
METRLGTHQITLLQLRNLEPPKAVVDQHHEMVEPSSMTGTEVARGPLFWWLLEFGMPGRETYLRNRGLCAMWKSKLEIESLEPQMRNKTAYSCCGGAF